MSSLIATVRSSAHLSCTTRSADPNSRFYCTILEYLEAIRSVETPQRWKVLVVDEHSQQLTNAVLKQYDILEENVTR